MTIKQKEAVKAYNSIKDLNRLKLSSSKLAKKIYDLFRQLKSANDFEEQEERKILDAHPNFDPYIGGIRLTADPEQRRQAAIETRQINDELAAIGEADFEMTDFEPFEIDLDQNPEIKISGEDIGNLERFITFN